MANKLVSFVKGILGKVNKYDIETDLEQSLDYLDQVIEMYKRATTVDPTGIFSNKENEAMVKHFYSSMSSNVPKGVKLTISKTFIRDSLILLQNVADNGRFIKLKLANFKSTTISPSAIGMDQSAVLRAVPHFHFISRFAGEFINCLIANGIKSITNAPTEIPKIQVDRLRKDMIIYDTLLFGYAREREDFRRVFLEIPEVIISPKQEDALQAYIDDFTGDVAPGLPNGFVGSPIYTIRSIIANWQAAKYHESVDMVKLYQLRLNYYESIRDNGQADAATEKEIAYLQNRVKVLSARIAKMEESVK